MLLVHETLNQVKEPRLAWLNAGQRRARRAPQVSYDGPGTAADGLRTSDNFDMYNGAPDRYDWKLEGKKEIYIPYNSYKLDDPKIKYSEIVKAGHINQDLTRYELHRVWHVVATLKPGERHIYAKRDFYIDEDTWQAAEIDHYDGRGTLWRVAEAHAEQYYDKQVPWYAVKPSTTCSPAATWRWHEERGETGLRLQLQRFGKRLHPGGAAPGRYAEKRRFSHEETGLVPVSSFGAAAPAVNSLQSVFPPRPRIPSSPSSRRAPVGKRLPRLDRAGKPVLVIELKRRCAISSEPMDSAQIAITWS